MSLPWHKWYHGTWLSSETRFSMRLAERGLYRDCLDLNYAEGSIPANPEILRRMLGLDQEEFEGAWPVVAKHFRPSPEDPTRLVNQKAMQVLADIKVYREKQADNGRRGGRPKGTKKPTKSRSFPNAKPELSQGKAGAKPVESQEEEEEDRRSSTFVSAHPSMSEWSDLFAQWWKIFPRRIAKSDARKAYEAIVVKGTVKPDQRSALKAYPNFTERHTQLVAATKSWTKLEFSRRERDKIPYPATFLRKLDWLSVPEESQPAASPIQMAWESDETYRARISGGLQ